MKKALIAIALLAATPAMATMYTLAELSYGSGTTASLLSSSGEGYNREVVVREGPNFLVENAVYGTEVPNAVLKEQLDIAIELTGTELDYVSLTAELLRNK